jgi:hypothetical protein
MLDFEERIVAVAFDEELGIWPAIASRGHFVSVNGKAFTEISLTEKVIIIVCLTVDSPRRPRATIVGMSFESLFVLELKFGRGIVDSTRLPSSHKDPIENLVVHPSMRAFISVDMEKTPNTNCEVAPGIIFAMCHACDAGASSTCPSCGRSVCGQCFGAAARFRVPFLWAFAWM